MSLHEEITKTSEMKFDGKLIKVTYDTAMVNGREAWREVVHHPGASAIIVIDDQNRIIMERQYRYALQQGLLEIPAGKLDAGEDPLTCAKRELEEETGYKSEELEWLITLRTTVAFCNEKIEVYVAKNLIPSKQHLDEDEFIDLKAYSLDELKEKIFTGEIEDAKTVASLMAYAVKYEA